jgi:hypothetical protein
MTDFVEQTWEKLGRRVRATGHTVFVRTEAPPEKSEGGIFYPDSSFYNGPFHLRLVPATVLSAGPRSTLKPGERVCFQRQWFCRWKDVPGDKTLVGWVEEAQITGVLEDDTKVDKFIEQPLGPKQCMPHPL